MKKQTKLDMMLEMIKYLQDKKLKFKKVIFDSWFAFPSIINQIKKEMNLDVICRIKLSDKIYQFVYKDKVYTVKNLYNILQESILSIYQAWEYLVVGYRRR